MDFRCREVLVTGASGALGFTVVAGLSELGATCHVPLRATDNARTFMIKALPNVRLIPDIDLSDAVQVRHAYAGISELWASIHVAGSFHYGTLETTEPSIMQQQVDTNLMTCLLCCREAVGIMSRRRSGGRIVNVTARAGLEWRQGASMVAYTAAKAGVAALSVALSEEVIGNNILVNAVAPSIIDTPANRQSMPKAKFESWPTTEDVAQTIIYLASPQNTATRGAVVPIYGFA